MAAHDAREAEWAAREEAERVPEYDEEADATIALVESIREQIARTPAHTLEGLAIKAQLVAGMMRPEERAELEAEGFLRGFDHFEAVEIMTSILRDLAHLPRHQRPKA